MAALSSIPGIEEELRMRVVEERKSYDAISTELKSSYPHLTRGLSARSVRRYCRELGIHVTPRLSDAHLDRIVASSVAAVREIIRTVVLVSILQTMICGPASLSCTYVRTYVHIYRLGKDVLNSPRMTKTCNCARNT